jgi:hemerythrin-like domain-containing protein
MLRDPALIPLSHDHQHALALCVLTDRALAGAGAADSVAPQARRILEQFDSEIRDHFEFEEQVLFPALATFPSVSDLVAELTMEHRRIVSIVESLRSRGDRSVIQEFCEVLGQHVRKEERLLFEEAQRLLSREQLDAIGQARLRGA